MGYSTWEPHGEAKWHSPVSKQSDNEVWHEQSHLLQFVAPSDKSTYTLTLKNTHTHTHTSLDGETQTQIQTLTQYSNGMAHSQSFLIPAYALTLDPALVNSWLSKQASLCPPLWQGPLPTGTCPGLRQQMFLRIINLAQMADVVTEALAHIAADSGAKPAPD